MGPFISRAIFRLDEVEDRSVYPFCLPLFRDLHELQLHPKVTFLVGENGSGKSTLLEALAVAAGFNPEGGSKNFNFRTQETHSRLHEFVTLVRQPRREKDGFFLRAESFYNVASNVDTLEREGGGMHRLYGGSLHQKSHGESFLALFTNRFKAAGLYFMDEPEAALSPSRQLALLQILFKHANDLGSQFVMATHSPILLAFPNAKIYELGEAGLTTIDYKETEHYQLTRDFLNAPEVFLAALERTPIAPQ